MVQPKKDAAHEDGCARTPHDRLFHYVFSNPVHAAGELQMLLPSELSRRMDWSTLETLPTRLVDQTLAELRSDVLFRAKLDGREVLLYLLLEHQSSPDPLMPFRLLEYVVKIWEQYLREHPGAHQLPAIVPMVLHHSEWGWTAPTNLREMIDLDDDTFSLVAPHLPTFELLLDDISKQKDEELRGRAMSDLARLTLLCLRSLRTSPQPLTDLRRWFDLCLAVLNATDGTAAFSALASYILFTTETQRAELRAFARELGPKAEEVIMTGAQMLIAEGRAEGEAKALLKLLHAKFGAVSEEVVTRVQTASIEDLDLWFDRALVAEALDAVFTS
jgi:predicted transposase/invertase (TIGR01784 family)